EGLDGPLLVFVNGRLIQARGLPTGATVVPLAQAIAEGHPACQELLGRIARPERHRFAALATALFADGVLLDLADDLELHEVVRLVFLVGGEQPGLARARVLVRAGPNSRVTIVDHYPPAARESLGLAVTEIALGPGAMLQHY